MSTTQQDNAIYVGGQQTTPSATYGLAEKISAGQVPNNEEMIQSLKDLETPLLIQSEIKPGVEGRFAYGASKLVQHTREMLQEKNSEDFLLHIQTHIQEAGEFLAHQAVQTGKVVAIGETWAAQQVNQLQQLVDAFRRMCIALGRKPEFRVKIIEAIQLLQEAGTRFTEQALNKAEETIEKFESKAEFSSSTNEIMKEISSQGIEGFMKEETPEDKEKKSKIEAQTKEAKKKMRGVLVELGKTPEYKETIEYLFLFFETNWAYLSSVLSNEVDRQALTSIVVLVSDVQGLVEKFSGDESLTPLVSRIAEILYGIPNDHDFQDYFKELKCVIKSTLESPESKNEQELENSFKCLSEKAKKLFKKKKLQEDLCFVFKELKGLVDRVREDESLKNLGEDVARLQREVLLNANGEIDLVTLRNVIPTLKNVLIPSLTTAFSSIPIPPLHIINEKYDINLSNLSLCARDLVPERIRIHFMNDILFDFTEENKDQFISSLYVGMRDFSAMLKDLNFKYDRKKTPMISDVGIADVEIIGTNIEVRWRMDFVGTRLLFYVDAVRCIIRELKTTVKESRHMLINKIASTFFNSNLKTRIEQTVENILREKLLQFSIDTAAPLSEQIQLAL